MFEKTRTISFATFRRNRSAWTKSTADRKRDWRNRLGQASGTCIFSWSTRRLSVRSSNAAAASANRITCSDAYGQSGSVTSTGTIPASLTVRSAARSTSLAGRSFIHAGM